MAAYDKHVTYTSDPGRIRPRMINVIANNTISGASGVVFGENTNRINTSKHN